MSEAIYINTGSMTLIEFYGSTLREPLFTTLISISALILAAKTYIVVMIKEKVIDNKVYRRAKYANIELIAKDEGIDLTDEMKRNKLFKPLLDLSWWLSIGVCATLLAGILQFTVGLFDYKSCVYTCLAAAAVSITIMCWNIWLSYDKLRDYYKYCIEFEIPKDDTCD